MNTTRPSTATVWSSLSSDLWKFIRKRVGDDHTADDLLQETFVRIHRSLANVIRMDSLAAWVYAIARNLVRDHYRRADDDAVSLPASLPARDEEIGCSRRCSPKWLAEMIQQLPDTYREAIQLSEIDGLAQKEVASRLGLSLSGTKSRVQRGRVLLKGLLDQCCTFDVDRRGNIVDYEPKRDRKVCLDCDE